MKKKVQGVPNPGQHPNHRKQDMPFLQPAPTMGTHPHKKEQTMLPKRDPKGRFLNKKGSSLIRPTCQAPGCALLGRYLIGSFEAEMERRPKWGWFCRSHEEEIASSNGKIAKEAKELGMKIAEYIAKKQRRR